MKTEYASFYHGIEQIDPTAYPSIDAWISPFFAHIRLFRKKNGLQLVTAVLWSHQTSLEQHYPAPLLLAQPRTTQLLQPSTIDICDSAILS